MRKLMDLVKKEKRVWVYIRTEELQDDFARRCAEEGFRFVNGEPVVPGSIGYTMGLHSDRTIAHLALFIWTLSYKNVFSNQPPRRIDYERYIQGCEDYICNESHFTPVSYTVESAKTCGSLLPRPEKNLSASEESGEKEVR